MRPTFQLFPLTLDWVSTVTLKPPSRKLREQNNDSVELFFHEIDYLLMPPHINRSIFKEFVYENGKQKSQQWGDSSKGPREVKQPCLTSRSGTPSGPLRKKGIRGQGASGVQGSSSP